MKKSFAKIVSVILAMMFAFTAMACMASAEGTTVINDDSSLNNTDTAGDTITSFKGARDIYLVLDISGSMSGTPIEKMKDAAKQFCATMLEDKSGDNRIAIVTYGTDVNTYSFSKDYAELANNIDSFKAKGSTAMYDALMAVKDMNEKYGNEDATKHVVVMADGLPNVGATLSSGKYTSKDSSMYYKYGNAVYSTAAGMWPDYLIYSIGFFHNLGGTQLKYGKTLMKDIQNALYLEVFDPDKLLDAFKGISDKITDNGQTTAATTAAPTTAAPTTAAPTTAAPTTAPTTQAPSTPNSIPKTGETALGVAAAAVLMAAGIAVVALKKKDN